jgi:hypothetical protein
MHLKLEFCLEFWNKIAVLLSRSPLHDVKYTAYQKGVLTPRIKKEPEIELGAGLRPGESHEVEFTRESRLGKVE